MKKKSFYRYVISALAKYDISILNKVTSEVTENEGNIDGMYQTIVHGYFTVVLTATFGKKINIDQLKNKIVENFSSKNEVSIIVKNYDSIIEFNWKRNRERYILTLAGEDRPGILKMLTTFLLEKNISIESYYFKIDGKYVTHIGEITIPQILDIKQLQDELKNLLSSISMSVSLHHENIFQVTNDVMSVRRLFREKNEK